MWIGWCFSWTNTLQLFNASAFTQPHRSACMAAAPLSCLLYLYFIFFPDVFFHSIHFPTFSQAWSFPGDRSHLRRWWQGRCWGTTGRQQTAALWRDTMWECTSQHTGWVEERGDGEFSGFFLIFPWSVNVEKNGYRLLSRAEQEETVETDKRREQEGGEASIVFVCFYWQPLTTHVSPFLSPPLGPL